MMTARAGTLAPLSISTEYGVPSHASAGGHVGHAHLSPEFLRLGVGAPCEILTRDAGGEAEIVLDLGAEAGLTSR